MNLLLYIALTYASVISDRSLGKSFWFTVNGGTHVAGLTPTARATVIALRLNNEYITEARALWIDSNWHPPTT